MGFSCSGRKLIPSYVSPRQPLEAGVQTTRSSTDAYCPPGVPSVQSRRHGGGVGRNHDADEVEVRPPSHVRGKTRSRPKLRVTTFNLWSSSHVLLGPLAWGPQFSHQSLSENVEKIHSGCGCTLISRLTNCSLNLLSLSRSRLSEHVHGPAKVHGPAHVVAAESPTPRIARSSSCRPPEASRTPPRTRGSPVPLVSLVRSEHSCPPDPMLMVLRITSLRGRRGN